MHFNNEQVGTSKAAKQFQLSSFSCLKIEERFEALQTRSSEMNIPRQQSPQVYTSFWINDYLEKQIFVFLSFSLSVILGLLRSSQVDSYSSIMRGRLQWYIWVGMGLAWLSQVVGSLRAPSVPITEKLIVEMSYIYETSQLTAFTQIPKTESCRPAFRLKKTSSVISYYYISYMVTQSSRLKY